MIKYFILSLFLFILILFIFLFKVFFVNIFSKKFFILFIIFLIMVILNITCVVVLESKKILFCLVFLSFYSIFLIFFSFDQSVKVKVIILFKFFTGYFILILTGYFIFFYVNNVDFYNFLEFEYVFLFNYFYYFYDYCLYIYLFTIILLFYYFLFYYLNNLECCISLRNFCPYNQSDIDFYEFYRYIIKFYHKNKNINGLIDFWTKSYNRKYYFPQTGIELHGLSQIELHKPFIMDNEILLYENYNGMGSDITFNDFKSSKISIFNALFGRNYKNIFENKVFLGNTLLDFILLVTFQKFKREDVMVFIFSEVSSFLNQGVNFYNRSLLISFIMHIVIGSGNFFNRFNFSDESLTKNSFWSYLLYLCFLLLFLQYHIYNYNICVLNVTFDFYNNPKNTSFYHIISLYKIKVDLINYFTHYIHPNDIDFINSNFIHSDYIYHCTLIDNQIPCTSLSYMIINGNRNRYKDSDEKRAYRYRTRWSENFFSKLEEELIFLPIYVDTMEALYLELEGTELESYDPNKVSEYGEKSFNKELKPLITLLLVGGSKIEGEHISDFYLERAHYIKGSFKHVKLNESGGWISFYIYIKKSRK